MRPRVDGEVESSAVVVDTGVSTSTEGSAAIAKSERERRAGRLETTSWRVIAEGDMDRAMPKRNRDCSKLRPARRANTRHASMAVDGEEGEGQCGPRGNRGDHLANQVQALCALAGGCKNVGGSGKRSLLVHVSFLGHWIYCARLLARELRWFFPLF